jgi:hypothetical protein
MYSILIIGLLVLFGGMLIAGIQKPEKLQIELGQTFRNDHVKIYLDKKLVFDKKVTTPDSGRIAEGIRVTKPKKPFEIMVEVNGAKFEKSSPKHETELDKKDYSLLINYNPETEEVEIKTKVVIVLYE